MLVFTNTEAQNPEIPDQTISPFFWVKSNGQADEMPLKNTRAEVQISGVMADIRIFQTYTNEGKETLEATYIFPASTRAAVYAMTMRIGNRTLVAKVEEKQKAREDYEAAREQGKTASLLEQERPNVFQMSVANILPGDVIEVELRYTELLVPTNGVYSFHYPTVVGPRYSETPIQLAASNNDKWVANPYLREGEAPPYTFGFEAKIQAGMPLLNVRCTSHQLNIQFDDKQTARLTLDDKDKFGANRDLIISYQIADKHIVTGLMYYDPEQATAVASADRPTDTEKFFLLMLEPPPVPELSQIPPREYIFVVDVSGSMYGFPLEVSKTLLRELIGGLRPTDRFNVLLFESSNAMLAPESMPATAENIDLAIKVIDQQKGGGRYAPASCTRKRIEI
jgi:Ca-activated chloride channel family protein